MNDKEKFIKETTEFILSRLGITGTVEISLTEEGSYSVKISGDDLGALIGYHGEALSSLQVLLGVASHKHFNEWLTIVVDAGGYREERSEKLKAMAQRAVDKVRFLSQPVSLPPLSSFERRLVHMYISEFPDIVSESEGEGYERHIVLKSKTETKEVATEKTPISK